MKNLNMDLLSMEALHLKSQGLRQISCAVLLLQQLDKSYSLAYRL
jgi:hypothetical protein